MTFELYEISSPPGNNGGAVSGAGPWHLAVETESRTAKDERAHFPQNMRSGLIKRKGIPPVKVALNTRVVY